MQVLWLKRDLRLQDHLPLRMALEQARAAGPVLVAYFHEPALLGCPDTAAQHVAFAQECLEHLREELRALGTDLLVVSLDADAALAQLHQLTPIRHLWAHAETTHRAGFERDKAVHRWARDAGVRFHELAQNAVLRGSARQEQRFDFAAHLRQSAAERLWAPSSQGGKKTGFLEATRVRSLSAALQGPLPPAPQGLVKPHREPGWLDDAPAPALPPHEDKVLRLSGGRAAAQEQLERFLQPANLLAYPGAISSPRSALNHCSRLSPYLARGVLSDREVLQALTRKLSEESIGRDPAEMQRLLSAARFFGERLYWRSSYLQAAEQSPDVDSEGGLPAFQGVRESERMNGWLQAWSAGQTGYPLVDAAMRMLNATGWLNMRLRGTVTSFALNDLWLPWQEVGRVLAREFLDYEPAIHWNQLQIHAGVSRYSGPLTYDPVKQAREHDSAGRFVRQWVPELRDMPTEQLFEPWRAPAKVQQAARCAIGRDYPAPLVRYPAANEAARQRVAALRAGTPVPASTHWKMRSRDVATQGQASLF
jgi:deoxyribodipyrimidine photo-lyase